MKLLEKVFLYILYNETRKFSSGFVNDFEKERVFFMGKDIVSAIIFISILVILPIMKRLRQ